MSDFPLERGTLLIVDDPPTNLEFAVEFLTENGFKVWVARSGKSALKKVEHSPLDNTKNKVKGFDIGAVDYITNPIQHKEVLAPVVTHFNLRNFPKKLEAEIQEGDRIRGELESLFWLLSLECLPGKDQSHQKTGKWSEAIAARKRLRGAIKKF